MLIPEPRARKEEIDLAHSAPVTMADGQKWWLPKPWCVIRPSFADGKMVAPDKLTYGHELDPMIRRIREEEDPFARIYATMALGAFLLERNYDLNNAEIESLVEYHPGDPASQEMLKGILDLAEGVGKKA